jgi:SAM-dependent methyltransferase
VRICSKKNQVHLIIKKNKRTKMTDFERHNDEIQQNIEFWAKKPILHTIYDEFYSIIAKNINRSIDGKIVEIGSGAGNLKKYVPNCICTDAFNNPWIDQVENAYELSFKDNEVSNIILFDVWHHLEYPTSALDEFKRVLKKQGRIIIFEPCISLLGWIVYGIFHPEDVGWFRKINTNNNIIDLNNLSYYAAQGNASRFFLQKKYNNHLAGFSITGIAKIPAIAYVLSGGYSKKQMFSDRYYPKIKKIESFVKGMPSLFATRLSIVLEKQ